MLEVLNNGVSSEIDYFEEIAVELNKLDLPWDLSLVFCPAKDTLPPSRFRKIVFVSSQENHSAKDCTSEAADVLLTFRNYYPLTSHNNPRLRPLPLGYQAGFRPVLPLKPCSQRPLDYFWAGAINCNRIPLQKALDLYQLRNTRGKVIWYDGWSAGSPRDEYAQILADSKIIFAPRGWVSPESSRYFEAVLSGCVIISEPKPNYWYYEQPPYLWPGHWELLPQFLDQLLADPQLLDEIQHYTLRYWERCCAPSVVARYVRHELELLLGGPSRG